MITIIVGSATCAVGEAGHRPITPGRQHSFRPCYPSRGDLTKLTRMFNLYSATTNQEAIRNLFKFVRDLTGYLPPLRGGVDL